MPHSSGYCGPSAEDIAAAIVAQTAEPRCCPIVADRCALVDGKIVNIQFGMYPDTGELVGWFTNSDTGESYEKEPVWVNCCGKDITACTQLDAFDVFDLDTLNVGGMREISLEVDGVIVSTIPHDYLTTNDGALKSSWYIPWVSAINALSGWTMTLVEDKNVDNSDSGGLSGSGKPTYQLEYSGTAPQKLRIYVGDVGNSITTDYLEIDVTADGIFTTDTGENNVSTPWSTYPFRSCT